MFKKRKSSVQATPEQGVKTSVLSIDGEEEDEVIVVIDRNKAKLRSKGKFAEEALRYDSSASTYDAAEIAALKESTKPREEQLTSKDEIVSGDVAERLTQNEEGDIIVEEEERDIGPAQSLKVQEEAGIRELIPSESSSSDDEDETGAVTEISPRALIDQFKTLHDNLTNRKTELREKSTVVPFYSSFDLTQAQAALKEAAARVRDLEGLLKYSQALASCMRVKKHQLKDGLNYETVWDDMKPEFASPDEIVKKLKPILSEDDGAQVRLGIASLLSPFMLTQAYKKDVKQDQVDELVRGDESFMSTLDALSNQNCEKDELVKAVADVIVSTYVES